MVPVLYPPSECTTLLKEGPLNRPRLEPYGRYRQTFYLSEEDEKSKFDYDYISWLQKKYGYKAPITHGIVQPTEKSMIEQVAKFGADPKGQPDPEIWKLACKATEIEFSALKGKCNYTHFDDVQLNMIATNGLPLNKLFADKGEAVVAYYNVLKWFVSEGYKDAPPQPIKLTGKVERLSLEEIAENKCRAFQPDPIQVVILEAMLNQDLTEKFKSLRNTFSAYGFNKWYGGWDSMFRQYESYEYKFAGDVRRWDKDYQSYHHDANTELKKTFINDEDRKRFETDEKFDWINKHAKNLVLMLWTGDLVRLQQGQGSGRFCTTLDNIITHTRVLYYHYYRVRKALGNKLPLHPIDIKTIYNCKAFGDDSFGATRLLALTSFEAREQSYRECGFELKKEDDFVSKEIEGVPFLGARNGVYRGRNVFVMNPERMHGSLTTLMRNMTPVERYERTYQLFLNCVFTEEKYPGLDVSVVQVLYDRINHLRSLLPDHELGAYGTILGIEAYRNFVLGLENQDSSEDLLLIRFLQENRHPTIAEYLPGQARDKRPQHVDENCSEKDQCPGVQTKWLGSPLTETESRCSTSPCDSSGVTQWTRKNQTYSF